MCKKTPAQHSPDTLERKPLDTLTPPKPCQVLSQIGAPVLTLCPITPLRNCQIVQESPLNLRELDRGPGLRSLPWSVTRLIRRDLCVDARLSSGRREY